MVVYQRRIDGVVGSCGNVTVDTGLKIPEMGKSY